MADLSIGSKAQQILEGAVYPSGRKAVLWHPIAGIATRDAGEAATEMLLWQLLYDFITETPSGEFGELLPNNSDLIVNWKSAVDYDEQHSVFTRLDFHSHIPLGIPGVLGLKESPIVSKRVGELLSIEPTLGDFRRMVR